MIISDLTQAQPLACTSPADGCLLPAEHRLEIVIDGRPALQAVCTPANLAELAAGRLLTEGLIRTAEDIRELTVSADCRRVEAVLNTAGAAQPEMPRPTPAVWERGWLLALADRMKREEPLYSQTHAVHACYLARQGEVLCCREDLGRHNALDKAVGYGLLQGIDLSECLLFTTGRMPSDMVLKAVRSGVPLLASKTYPTDVGLALARRAGLTLATVRAGEVRIWTERGTEEKRL